MRPRADGDFDVEPDEKITFKVVREDTLNKATINCRVGWASCDPEKAPDDKTKTKTCQARSDEGNTCSTTVGVDFRNDPMGSYDPNDEYTIEVSGSEGGSTTDTISPPPVLNSEDFVFHVNKSA